MKGVEVLSSTNPMNGIEAIPPKGRAASKKLLRCTAEEWEARR